MDGKRWWQLRGDDAATAVVGIVDGLVSDDAEPRQKRFDAALALYESDGLRALEVQGVETRYNVSRSAVDTAHAEIAARQRPKPMYQPSGNADWDTKRKARKLDRFVEATLHQRQGCYADAWELAEDMFRAAAIGVGAAAKVSADLQGERIRIDHIPAHEVMVDPEEARTGDPQNWFHEYLMDLDTAVEMFAGDGCGTTEERSAIEAKLRAASMTEARRSGADTRFRLSERVKIREAWRLPLSAEKPGRHVIACGSGCLYEEDWTWPCAPFAILVWNRDLFSIWGHGLVEEGAHQHVRIQEVSERMHDRFDKCAQKVVYYEPGMVDEKAMLANDSVVYVPVRDLSHVPQERNVPPITPAESQFLAEEIGRFYELQGVSQMSAAARKDPGVDAAVAIQTLNDIKSVRFLPKARAYELLFVRLGELIVRAMRDLAVEKPGLVAKWPGKHFLQEMQWRDVNIPEDLYEVRVAPVSSMSRDPAQRLQIAEQLAASGRLPDREYKRLLVQLTSLDEVLEDETKESQWVEALLDRYLDAKDADDLEDAGGYEPPEGIMGNPALALFDAQSAYFGAKLDGAPDYNLSLLVRYIRDLEKIITKAQQPPPPAAAPAMPGMGLGVAGAGPGPVPPAEPGPAPPLPPAAAA